MAIPALFTTKSKPPGCAPFSSATKPCTLPECVMSSWWNRTSVAPPSCPSAPASFSAGSPLMLASAASPREASRAVRYTSMRPSGEVCG